ncbi:glycosyltransferase [Nonomuraea endophytica]|uniref:Glycosyltransferase involved in cell wall biosynthesis n=1 Tax=Nonomuraea endophytica TaxID=714136 RepID=A0A7W8A1N9_9ACTN|nr:glycosyltransferase [Nonomuraea endophytica]MBB5077225.1 glycosyltransferase involved in cell wall biosynthesis [Nonomuraea endophytica]
MRIAMISEHADPLAAIGGVDAGGQNVHVAALASALAARGHTVVVHTRRTSPHQAEPVPMGLGVTVDYVPAGPAEPVAKDGLAPYMPDFARILRERWRRERPDVIHAHFWMSGQAALAAAADVPVVLTYHALGTVKRRWQGAADTSPPHRVEAEREIGRRADAIVATCADEVRELAAMGVPSERVSVVPCGVDLDRFHPAPPDPLEASRWWCGPRTGGRVLCIARLVPRKGVDTVVQALRRLPGVELLIAGGVQEDGELARLRGQAATHGLAGRVRLIGSVARPDVPSLMRSADVVVSVPWYEPFGIVPIEAMACGVPVVASAVGGHLDTVAGWGPLVPPRRPRALARALRELLESPERRAELGAAGARRARRRYNWPRVAERTEAVYAQVISGRIVRLEASGC